MTHRKGQLYIISAASATGKTSLLRQLIKEVDQIKLSVSYTTRAPRSTEQEGKDYFFVTQDHFDELLAQDEFLEHAHVFDHSYATGRSVVQKDLSAGNDVILEIDYQGAQQIRRKMPEAQSIFILPPSKAALRERITKRDQDHPDMIKKRLAKAAEEISHYHEYDYLLVNDDFGEALDALKAIILSNHYKQNIQQEYLEQLIKDLLS